MLAGVFGTGLIVALIVLDWIQFTSLSTSRYGCRIAKGEECLPLSRESVLARFNEQGVLRLRQGIARCFRDEGEILLRPQYHFLSSRFRTAWPLKASIQLHPAEAGTRLVYTKRMPWSSALLTLAWFLVVGVGTVTFMLSFLFTGGWESLSGLLMGLGVAGLGALVLLFGVIVVSLAYRLEDQRLRQAYQELRGLLSPDVSDAGR